MPWLDKLLHKNFLVGYISGLFSKQKVSPVLRFALDRIADRKMARNNHPGTKGQDRDFLSRFLDIQDSRPDIPDL